MILSTLCRDSSHAETEGGMGGREGGREGWGGEGGREGGS